MEPYREDTAALSYSDAVNTPSSRTGISLLSSSHYGNGLHQHGHSTGPPAHRTQQPKASRKPTFHGNFKQAVFQQIGKEDGSSNIHVTFSSSRHEDKVKSLTNVKTTMVGYGSPKAYSGTVKAILGHSQPDPRPTFRKPISTTQLKIKPKPAPVSVSYKEIAPVDKKKIQEEIESVPKPTHLLEAQRELLSFTGLKPSFFMTFDDGTRYKCVGCLDVFPSSFALDDHLHRQSYQLLLDCPQCLKKFTFGNKCQMYKHLIEDHELDSSQCLQITGMYVNLQALPRSSQVKISNSDSLLTDGDINGVVEELGSDIKMESNGTEPDVSLDIEQPKELFTDSKNSKPSINGTSELEYITVKPKPEPLIVEPVNENEEESDEGTSISCTECSRTFESEWTLQTHFSLPRQPITEPEVCIPCKVELLTPCARSAHMRVHGLAQPFVCPDCGQSIYRKNVFLKHLRLQCLHYSTLSEFTCPGCPEGFNSADEQLSHLKSNSSHKRFDGERSYYKCNGCPKAFKSVAAHSKHESCPGAGCTVVHMCNNCPQQTVFRSWVELTEHRAQAHPELVWESKRSRMFGCYLCAHKCRTKPGLLDHLLKTHGKKKIDHMCHYCGVEFDSRQGLETHFESCAFKDEARGTIRAPLALIERKPKLSSSSDTSTGNAATSPPENGTVTDPTELGKSGRPNDESGTPTTDKSSLKTLAYLPNLPSFNCHICAAEFSNYDKLRDHATRFHDGQGLIYECWLCRDRGSTANFYRQSALDKHMVDAHKMQMTAPAVPTPTPAVEGVVEDETEKADSDSEIPRKKMRIWDESNEEYQCCRCHYKSMSGNDFKEHIKEHKASTDSHQCAECGTCFTVQLALRRHLFAVHKVADYAKYSRMQYMAEFEKQLHDTQGKCPICDEHFEEDTQLRKHLRTHGMMYINTKRVVPT